LYRDEGGALPDVCQWRRADDALCRVRSDLPGTPTTLDTGIYVNSALGGNLDSRWVFQKCFKMHDIYDDYATGVEPPMVDRPAVKLYVRLTENGEIMDVSSILPSTAPET
jgi:hypothetical protein